MKIVLFLIFYLKNFQKTFDTVSNARIVVFTLVVTWNTFTREGNAPTLPVQSHHNKLEVIVKRVYARVSDDEHAYIKATLASQNLSIEQGIRKSLFNFLTLEENPNVRDERSHRSETYEEAVQVD